MEVLKNEIDNCNAIITVNIDKGDISENVENKLADYRKKAKVPGFRPGKVPAGMIKKMYGNAIIAEELNKSVSQALFEFIKNEKLNVLGDPLPNEKQEQVDFNNQETFSFIFDIALAPEFELSLTKREKIVEYIIKVDKKLKQSFIENYQNKFGNFIDKEIADEKSIVRGNIVQIDKNGNIAEGGISAEDSSVDISLIKDKKIQSEFIGAQKNKTIDFDIKKAFENETEISALLKIKKEEVNNIEPDFKFTVYEIKEFTKAEINQELFDKAFGEGTVKSNEEFESKIEQIIKENFASETSFLLAFDIKEKFVNKLGAELPEAFLKRWLKATNKEITEEQLEQEFPHFIENLKWSLIKSKLTKEHEIKVSEEELLDAAKKSVIRQLQKYGISNIPDEQLNNYASEMLKKDDEKNRAFEQKLEEKVVEIIKENIKIEQKQVAAEEMDKIFSERFKK